MKKILAGFCVTMLLAGASHACTPKVDVATLFEAWRSKQAIQGLDIELSMAEAECIRAHFQKALEASAGAAIGYKVGLTNAKVQKALGHDAPISGKLLASMLLPDGVQLPAQFGTRPLMEADLLVEVGDDAINTAKTAADVLPHLSRILPFIELPDLLIDPKTPISGIRLTALNVGARLGVVGQPLDARSVRLEDLASMQVLMQDGEGKTLAQGKGSDILDHPLNAVVWLIKDLALRGERLKKGDLISLGSFNPPIKPQAGQKISVSYPGLPGMQEVRVGFLADTAR